MIHKILDATETGIMSPVFMFRPQFCIVLLQLCGFGRKNSQKKIALEELCLAFYLIHP